jgi:hypothetical protein
MRIDGASFDIRRDLGGLFCCSMSMLRDSRLLYGLLSESTVNEMLFTISLSVLLFLFNLILDLTL